MTDDIVARLRDYHAAVLAAPPYYRELTRIAADEIERLRAVVEAWLKYSQRAERDIETLRAERDEARRERDGYLEGNRQTLAALAEANEIAKRYRAERDEARRMVCELDADIMEDQIEYAKHRGWDCYKEKP